MSYAVLYKANETDFNTLGLGVLRDAISPLVTEERNGQFELTMSYPVDGALFDEIKNDRIIKADASQKLKAQRFKIIRITKPAGGVVKVYAEHVSYLSQDLALKPSVSYNGNATQALTAWKNNIVDAHPFTIFSDIQTTGSGVWTIDKVENARRALGGVAGSILDTYGGEYRFDNYHVGLYANRGSDSGALIAYGKNLTDIEQEEEIANTYTSIYPYTNIRDEEGNESLLTLPEYFVDSEYTSNYARRKIKTINFQQDDITTVEQLRERAQQYIADNDIGVPSVNLTVKFVDLSKTLDYKDLALVEEINLCDQVTVYYEKLGIRQKAKVIKTIWNVALDRYEELVIGKARANLSQSIGTTVDGKLETVVTDLNSVRISADGKTKIFTGVSEPIATNINDLWYKPVEDGGVEMYRCDGVIWGLQKSSAGALAGTIDFSTVQAINIDANSITTGSLRAELIRVGWNNINSQVGIDADGLWVENDNGEKTYMKKGGLSFINKYAEDAGWIGMGYNTADNTINGMLIGADYQKEMTFGRKATAETGSYTPFMRLEELYDLLNFYVPIELNNYLEMNSNTIWNVGEIYGGGKIRLTTNNSGTQGSIIYNASNQMLLLGSVAGVSLGILNGDGVTTTGKFEVRTGENISFQNLNMNGNIITNQSDIRLKKNVVTTALDGIAAIEKMRFIEFEWDKENPYNATKPDGLQFGMEAQYAACLQVTDQNSNYLSVDSSKQINLNTLAIQQMISRLKQSETELANTKKELADLKQLLIDGGVS